jgi:fermentation-respiration switch protein FrsA (DUF1100 family)
MSPIPTPDEICILKNSKAIKTLRTLVLLYGGVCLVLSFMQRDLMYYPDRTRPDPALYHASDMQVVSVQVENGLTLQGWYKPPSAPDKPVIVHYHGNAGNIGSRALYLRPYMDHGYGLLLAEYRGFGGNGGKLSEEGFYRDAEAWLQWVLKDENIPPQRVFLYGESLGTGIATQTALAHPDLGGMILESAFTSFVDMAQRLYPFLPATLLVVDRYETLSKISNVKIPLLMIHGTRDSVVPFAMGQKVFAAADSENKTFHAIPNADHNNIYNFDAVEQVTRFVDFVSLLARK